MLDMKKALLFPCLALGMALTSFARDEGVTESEIRIGASMVQSGPLGPAAVDYANGSRLYFDHVNSRGGIHGRKIVNTILDDGFDVEKAVENTRKLLSEEKVFVIFNNSGTAHTAAILPLAEESRTIVFGPSTGATMFREKFSRLLFHVRASYADEARRIVEQLKVSGIERIAVCYQDDAFGNTLLSEVRSAAEAEGLRLAALVGVNAKQPNFTAVAQELVKANPQAVIFGTAGMTLPRVVKAIQQTAARPSYYGFSLASLEVINQELGEAARGIVLAQIMPSLSDTSVPLVAEYQGLLASREGAIRASPIHFEGYVHAKILVEGFRRAGRSLTTETFIRGMESAGEIAYGKFVARYSSKSHNGSRYVELAIIGNRGQLRR